MKILIIEDELDLREVLVFMLESQFAAQVFEAESGSQAIHLLSKGLNVDLILSDYNMPNGNGGDVFKFLLSRKATTPFILCSSDSIEMHPEFQHQKQVSYVEKPLLMESLIKVLRKTLPSNKLRGSNPESLPGFCRIKISSLMRMSALACDLYLKLGQDKYIKVGNGDDWFEEVDFNRFSNKGLEYLYIPKESAVFFLEKLTREVLSFKNAKAKTPSNNFQLSEKIQNIVQELGIDLGFTPEVQKLIKANVELAFTTIESNPTLKELLKDMLNDRTNYISSHSVALAHIAVGLAVQMEWQIHNSLFKVALAAFLHDITLRNQDLAQVHSVEGLSLSMSHGKMFSDAEIAQFMKHPEDAALMATQIDDIPPNVDTIIAQHHESPDGKGFPSHLTHSRIFPLSCVFIVAHDIVSSYWVKKDDFDIHDFLHENESRYGFGYFKKIARSIALNHRPRETSPSS